MTADQILIAVIGIFLASTGWMYLANAKKKGSLDKRDRAVSIGLLLAGALIFFIPGITMLNSGDSEVQSPQARKSKLLGEEAFTPNVQQLSENYEKASELYAKGAALWDLQTSTYDSTEQAMKYFNESIQTYETAEALVGRGQLKMQLSKMDDAMKDYNRAIQVKPEFANAYFNRAALNYIYGDTQKACDDWRKAAKLGLEQAQTVVAQMCGN